MSFADTATDRDWGALRKEIGGKVRLLRTQRRWTQAELAQRLALSQTRLSEIERGLGSFSAEHLLELFRLFNVDASHFASSPLDQTLQLQDALARLGARQLVESETALPSDRIAHVNQVIVEALADARDPRLVAALAPVLVVRIDEVMLDVVAARLEPIGLTHRLRWLVDNTVAALDKLDSPREALAQRRRAQLVLRSWLARTKPTKGPGGREDILDATIRSEASAMEVKRTRSSISRRWGIVSSLFVDDFVVALRG